MCERRGRKKIKGKKRRTEKEETEGRVRALLGIDVEFLLEILQEVWHQLDVLEEDPVTLIVAKFKALEGNLVLAITERDNVHVGEADATLTR